MITRKHRVQLIAFLVIAVVSVAYVGLNYAGLGKMFGTQGYVVIAEFDEPGGVFVGSEVTYRGVAVGSVTDISLTDTGLAVELTINDDAPPIPADTSAAVANRSPIGEQYVDLRPAEEKPPYLDGGDVIRDGRTSTPVGSSTVLRNLNELVNSIDKEALRTVVDEAHDAFAGSGRDLQVLLDSLSSFSATAQRNASTTQQLLADARTVLRTQRENADNLTTFASGLDTITKQLAESDGDLRGIVDDAPPLAKEVRSFLAESGSELGVFFANMLTTARVTSKRVGSFETLLIGLPVIAAQSKSRAPDGTGHLGVVLNFFNPPSCTKGYDTEQRPPSDISEDPPNVDAYCAEPPGSQTGVRGAQNAPYGGVPVRKPEQGGDADSDADAAADSVPERAGSGDETGLVGMLDLSTSGGLTGSMGTLLGTDG